MGDLRPLVDGIPGDAVRLTDSQTPTYPSRYFSWCVLGCHSLPEREKSGMETISWLEGGA